MGYGGYSISNLPVYRPQVVAWLELGGVWVSANIRGGGEYGRDWHHAALGEKRQNAFDDFIAVAEHLVKERVTAPAKLAIWGRSNGGLLVTVVSQQRPELYAAVISGVPVTDMLRFDRFTGGRHWISEYGSPRNPQQFQNLLRYSPSTTSRPAPATPPLWSPRPNSTTAWCRTTPTSSPPRCRPRSRALVRCCCATRRKPRTATRLPSDRSPSWPTSGRSPPSIRGCGHPRLRGVRHAEGSERECEIARPLLADELQVLAAPFAKCAGHFRWRPIRRDVLSAGYHGEITALDPAISSAPVPESRSGRWCKGSCLGA